MTKADAQRKTFGLVLRPAAACLGGITQSRAVALILGVVAASGCSRHANGSSAKAAQGGREAKAAQGGREAKAAQGSQETPAEASEALATASAASNVRLVTLTPAGHEPVTVSVELAHTEEERRVGLMYRRELAEDSGMLFIYESEQPLVFWMKNTLIPLDMIFIDGTSRVVGVVENAEPMTETARAVSAPSQFCLEVNAGFAQRHGVGVGTRVTLPKEARELL